MVRLFCLVMIMLGGSSKEVGSCPNSIRFEDLFNNEILTAMNCSHYSGYSSTEVVSKGVSHSAKRWSVIRRAHVTSIPPKSAKLHKPTIDSIRQVHRIDWQHSRSVEGRGVLRRGLDVELSESFVDLGRLFVGVSSRKGNLPPGWSVINHTVSVLKT